MSAPSNTSVVLYDGHCPFCRKQADRLLRWATRGARIEVRDFQQPHALDDFPGLTQAQCMDAMRLVAPDGRVYSGAEAVARVMMTRPLLRPLAYVYYLPLLRRVLERAYRFVARRRYTAAKRARLVHCDGTTCSVHFS